MNQQDTTHARQKRRSAQETLLRPSTVFPARKAGERRGQSEAQAASCAKSQTREEDPEREAKMLRRNTEEAKERPQHQNEREKPWQGLSIRMFPLALNRKYCLGQATLRVGESSCKCRRGSASRSRSSSLGFAVAARVTFLEALSVFLLLGFALNSKYLDLLETTAVRNNDFG